MARNQRTVDTATVTRTAGVVKTKADEYNQSYTALFATVKDLASSWVGADSTAFTNQIEGFRDDFQRMEQLMRDYAAYLEKVVQTYEAEIEANKLDAAKLSQGS